METRVQNIILHLSEQGFDAHITGVDLYKAGAEYPDGHECECGYAYAFGDLFERFLTPLQGETHEENKETKE
jgi:hypothetical protein